MAVRRPILRKSDSRPAVGRREILIVKLEGKETLGRPNYRLEHNIEKRS
jgi:hypothetical protein